MYILALKVSLDFAGTGLSSKRCQFTVRLGALGKEALESLKLATSTDLVIGRMAIGPNTSAAGQWQGNLWGAEATQTASWGLLPRHITSLPKVVFISLMWLQTWEGGKQGSQLGMVTLAL